MKKLLVLALIAASCVTHAGTIRPSRWVQVGSSANMYGWTFKNYIDVNNVKELTAVTKTVFVKTDRAHNGRAIDGAVARWTINCDADEILTPDDTEFREIFPGTVGYQVRVLACRK